MERDYWLNRFSGEWTRSGFPYDHLNGGQQESFGLLYFRLDGESFSNLERLSSGSDHRLFMILLSQLSVLFYKYTGSTDVIVGAPIVKQDVEGDFINTVLALRNTFHRETTFKELLLQVRQTVVEAAEHQNYPIEALLHKLNLKEDGSGGFPLFSTALLLENIHCRDYIKHIPVDMQFSFRRVEGAVEGKLEYDPAHYKSSTMKGITRHFKFLALHLRSFLDTPLLEIEILSAEEKKQLLKEFNDTDGDYPEGKTIHQWFEEQVLRTPDTAALNMSYSNDTSYMTYYELNRKSNRLANCLRKKGVGPDIIVGLLVERSLEMIVGLLGILKAGGAFLPIDNNYPDDRKGYMFTDSGINLLLTDGTIDLPVGVETLDITSPRHYIGDDANPPHMNSASDLVYLIYTSGSTGRPKGVMLEHKNVVNLIHFDFVFTNMDFSKVLQFHTIGFDASFHEIFCALLSGGTSYLIREETRADIPALFEVVEKNCIMTLFLPMSYLRMIFNEESHTHLIPRCVRHIQTAGEQVVVSHRFRQYLKESNVYLHNHYGPAETHVVTALTLDPAEDIPELPTIGKPILNTQIYILDKDGQLSPVGVPGELYIGGIQVGRGYLERPDLTAERFNFFIKENRTYRTGDLARWLPDGNIDFLGRVDKQVKIRGFRVEPGEVESRLVDIDYIREASVLDRTDEKGDKFLCAYVVSNKQTNGMELRERLSEVLPDFMIPSFFIQLEEIPLTPNGKVDRDKLRAMEVIAESNTYAPPRDELENKLCELWAEILGLEKSKIGIDDNFFQLGGHSLKATILITRTQKVLNIKLSLGEIFSQPTVRGMAEFAKNAKGNTLPAIKPVEERLYYPMSSSQKRMYILNQLEKESTNYNMPAALTVEGEISREKFEQVFLALIRRQEGLRTCFVLVDGEPVQKVEQIENIHFKIYDGETLDMGGFVRPFDLSSAPLLRVGLVKLEEKKHILMVDIHHIIGDGVSLGILVREFTRIYGGETLSTLTIQYKDYSVWQQELARSGELKKQEIYWLEQLSEEIPQLNLPFDFTRPAMMRFVGRWLDFEIRVETAAKLRELADEYNVTLFMVVLAAYNILLYKYTGNETIMVGTAIAGRSHPDLENIIGVFLNTLVLKNNPRSNITFVEFLAEVGKRALEAYENQDYQFEELVEKLGLRRDYSRNPVFDTMLNFVNMEIPEVRLKDLRLTPVKMEQTAVKFDIKINVRDEGESLRCTLDYSTELFKQETMDSFIGNFVKIMETVAKDPTVKISNIGLISEGERRKLEKEFNEELEYEF
jgi:amino acid adenylation domain-containing protein